MSSLLGNGSASFTEKPRRAAWGSLVRNCRAVVAALPRHETQDMPPVRSARNRKPPPDGFDDIEDTLLEFANKMKDAENASHEGRKRHEVLWPIFQISHQRMSFSTEAKLWLTISVSTGSRYIYDLYYDKEAISKQLYEWLLKNGYADGNLIAKWKKQGYEKVRLSREASVSSTDGARIAVVLPTMHPDKRDEFQCNLHLSSTAGAVERRPIHRMCELRVSRLFFC